MKWNDLKDLEGEVTIDGQVLTDIECPDCGRKIFFDTRTIFTNYPEKYLYWCRCGWVGCSHIRWEAQVNEQLFY